MSVSLPSKKSKLDDFQLKDDGSAVEFTGRRLRDFRTEMKARTLSNGVITFMKHFPGFADWWFHLPDEERDEAFADIQLEILEGLHWKFHGDSNAKAAMLRDNLIWYLDHKPGFGTWKEVILGSTLRERAHHQLKDYLLKELKK